MQHRFRLLNLTQSKPLLYSIAFPLLSGIAEAVHKCVVTKLIPKEGDQFTHSCAQVLNSLMRFRFTTSLLGHVSNQGLVLRYRMHHG